MDFEKLKSNKSATLDALQKQLEELTNPGKKGKDDYKDDRFWVPSVDKMGNGGAVIRFLPSCKSDTPFEKVWSHGFQGPTGMWYIENSRTTIGEKDPCGDYNTKLWNAGNEDQARKQKRKLSFIANILVIKDPSNPANNGKVFLFKFGKKIFEKIDQALNPPFDEEGNPRLLDDDAKNPAYNPTNAIDPFNMWEGAPFRLLIRKVDGYRNYDLSKFDSPAPISDDDDDIREIYDMTYDVKEFVQPDQFKSYEELQNRLNKVMGFESDIEHSSESKKSKKKDFDESKSNVSDDDDEIDLDKLMEELG